MVSNNHKRLSQVARTIASVKDYKMAGDLLNETYVDIAVKEKEFPKNNDEFIKWFSACMKNHFRWSDSQFNKIKCKEFLVLDNEKNFGDDGESEVSNKELIEDPDALKNIDVFVEGANDATSELIEISSSLGKVRTLQYIDLIEFKRTLLEYEKILFDLYFEKRLSCRTIAHMYSDNVHKMDYQSVNKMINIIKTKIKSYPWRQLNS